MKINKNNNKFLKPLLIFKFRFSPSYLLLFPYKKATFGHLQRCPLSQVATASALPLSPRETKQAINKTSQKAEKLQGQTRWLIPIGMILRGCGVLVTDEGLTKKGHLRF